MPSVIAFDVNETLLDMSALDPLFEEAFGDAAARDVWFTQMLQLAFVGGLTGRYVDFGTAQRAALAMLAAARGAELPEGTADRVAAAMRSLPPHPDVSPALGRLREAGFRIAALTNSQLEVARDQLRHAGLEPAFDAILSADEVKALKPRAEAYALVADAFDTTLADVRLVAAHAWDVSGALAAGCAAAFVARAGKVPSPLGDQPDVIGATLTEVAAQVVARDAP